jgi:glucose/mannose transport system permease protein
MIMEKPKNSPENTKAFFSDGLLAIALLVPSLIAIAIFVYGFIGWTAYTSMTNASLASPTEEFVGFENYDSLFTALRNKRFRTDIVNTVYFTTLFIAVCLGVGLFLAILLDQKVKGEAIFRTIYLFPMALSFIVTAVVWKWLFHPVQGINALPTLIGQNPIEFRWFISSETWFEFNWQDLGNYISGAILLVDVLLAYFIWRWYKIRNGNMPYIVAALLFLNTWLLLEGPQKLTALSREETHGFNIALFALIIAAGWQMSGYVMAMYLAGLRGISDDLREAARVDGASEWGVYRHVVLPLLQPITLSAMIILGHISLKIFDLVYGMGGGDNLHIDMPGVNMFFTTFRGGAIGRGAAIAVMLLVMVAFVVIPYLRSNLKSETEL